MLKSLANANPYPYNLQGPGSYARVQNLWIFEPQSRAWYTPEEFHEKFGHCLTGLEDFFANCQPRNPTEGVSAGMTRLQRLQEQLSGFMDKIVTYYKNR